MKSYYKQASLEHSLSVALLHICLLREQGEHREADAILHQLLAAFESAKNEVKAWHAK